MEFFSGLWTYGVPFVITLSILIFVHEMGHYLVARWNGVRVETFSIGFGPELFGWTDRVDTRWKVAAIPLGGYVKMFGDANAASMPGDDIEEMTPEERAVSFQHKGLWPRVAIVIAGPAANFLFAIVVYAILFMTAGQPFTPPEVSMVVAGSAAEKAGILPGDIIKEIDDRAIERFEDIQNLVSYSPEIPLRVVIDRGGQVIVMTVTPTRLEIKDRLGGVHSIGRLGIGRSGAVMIQQDPATAVWQGAKQTLVMTGTILKTVGQMIAGTRPADEIGGVLRIGQIAGEVAKNSYVDLVRFMAILSINLGLINLFPIPILDGGHLLFYLFEAVRGRPLGAKAQDFGLRIGLALVLMLVLFATWNDLVHFGVVEFFMGLVT
jgi:regulator of sigma E protease